MHVVVLGSGAVGGYYGAKLARAGHRVTFLARRGHLRAIRERGLLIWSPLGDFVVQANAEEDPACVEQADVVLFAVKTYDNATAIPMLAPLVGPSTTVLTLQNGVDSAEAIASAVGRDKVVAGSAYIAAALSAPGLIEQTGTHRRIIFGEVFSVGTTVSGRVSRIADAMASADIEVEAVADARVPIWEKFIYLAPFAAFTGAARLPVGPLWADADIRAQFLAAVAEVEAIARAERIPLSADLRARMLTYAEKLPPSTRSSLLIDLSQGKRIEVDALQGAVVRRGRAAGVPTPIMATLYAVLKPYEHGAIH
ncbi:MAG: 2-dehydropantoate 2-reductase [Acidobacteria bacterium]|nr:2-dehydropantoate 2-reductase [Acidobacteriota bacterium]